MDSLTFRCPKTGIAIDSGFETDPDTRSQLRLFTLRLACPACAEAHQFTIGDAATATGGVPCERLPPAAPAGRPASGRGPLPSA